MFTEHYQHDELSIRQNTDAAGWVVLDSRILFALSRGFETQ